MGNRAGIALSVTVAVMLLCGKAGAGFEDLAIGAKTGSLGIGGELTTDLTPQLHLRGSVQWLAFDFETEIDDVDYDVDVDFFNPLVLLDWYPFENAFRVSAGVLFNGTDLDLEATTDEPVEIGDTIYFPGDIGSIRGESDFDDVAPYIGIGFGNPLSRDRRWGFTADIGVVYLGSPNVDLTATGPFANNPAFQADLAKEEEEIEDDLGKLRFYPVMSLNLFYRF